VLPEPLEYFLDMFLILSKVVKVDKNIFQIGHQITEMLIRFEKTSFIKCCKEVRALGESWKYINQLNKS